MTALGTAIEERVILPFVVQRAQNHTLSKPVLVSTCDLLSRCHHFHHHVAQEHCLWQICQVATRGTAVVQLITITDGEPTNEPEHKVFQVIKRAKDFMSQTPYGPKAIAFEFAQARTSLRDNMERQVSCCSGPPDAARILKSEHRCVVCATMLKIDLDHAR